MGQAPARIKEFGEYIRVVKGLLAGEEVDYALNGVTHPIRFQNLQHGAARIAQGGDEIGQGGVDGQGAAHPRLIAKGPGGVQRGRLGVVPLCPRFGRCVAGAGMSIWREKMVAVVSAG